MRIVVLVSEEGGVRIYHDSPQTIEAIVVDEDCPKDFAEDDHRTLEVNKGSEDEAWTLEGAFFDNDAASDPEFVASVFAAKNE